MSALTRHCHCLEDSLDTCSLEDNIFKCPYLCQNVYILNSHPHYLPLPPDMVFYRLDYAQHRLIINLVTLKDRWENYKLATYNVFHVKLRHLILSAF